MAPQHHTVWMEAMDDSLEAFLGDGEDDTEGHHPVPVQAQAKVKAKADAKADAKAKSDSAAVQNASQQAA